MKDEALRRFRHKWWGWGPEGMAYDLDSRPGMAPFITAQGIDLARVGTPPVDRGEVVLPARTVHEPFEAAAARIVGADAVRTDDDERLLHAYGRSYRDLVRLRAGLVDAPPDLVVLPVDHDQVQALVEAAAEHDVRLIPYGGGTNVVGSLEPEPGDPRPVATLAMRHMDRLLEVDVRAMTARFQAGIFGPRIEEALASHGVALGHHPDSFVHSTLGGWIATRSAGTQSNAWGKIEDMVEGVTMATPRGTLRTKPLPAASNGPDLNRLVVGSEGILGVITEATVRVHPAPEYEDHRMLLFPDFATGFEALLGCVRGGYMPSLARLSDEAETELMFAARHPSTGLARLVQAPIKAWLRARGYARPAALVLGFEGPDRPTRALRRGALRILRRHGGVDLGRGPGESWKRSRYDVPYLRDFVMDHGAVADSFETAVSWSGAWDLYTSVDRVFRESIERHAGRPGYLGCHISHLYDTGACVYFTFATATAADPTPQHRIDAYTAIKADVTRAFLDAGGALSHHHAVGREHRPWLREEVGEVGVRSLRALKRELDPAGILNPGALLGPDR